jgi:hypothetical protein
MLGDYELVNQAGESVSMADALRKVLRGETP